MRIDPIQITIQSQHGTESRSIPISCVAGTRFSSRDVEGMRRELDQRLASDGHFTGATRTNPSIYKVGRYLLTQSSEFDVQGPMTGGEAEVVAIRCDDECLISVGSDQCDRELDALFPDKPKQMCPHPIATVAWPYEEVRDHWDDLRIYGEVIIQGHHIPLQDSPLSVLVDMEYLLGMEVVQALPNPLFLYGGACPFLESAADKAKELNLPETVSEGVGDGFLVRLHDPVLTRTIEHTFHAVPVGDDLAERS